VAVLVGLMDAVLDFSRMSAGDLQPDLRATDLPTLLASLESQTRPAAQARGLQLRVQPCAGCVLSDEALLLRVLANVVHNAVRYTPHGGVLVRAHPVRGHLRVLVADSGIGIPSHLQARVFDAYFQVDNPERDRRKGLGLGLAIVRDLGRLLGLRVRMRSRPGRGTVFAIDIPEAQVPPRPQDGPDGLARDYVQGALVLLIDDDPLARDGMAVTLRNFGCRVLDAGSGSEAAQRLAASEFVPQVIVSDLRLAAGVSGARLALDLAERQAQALGPDFRPLLMVVTGDTQIARVATDDGGDDLLVLKKPVAPHTLYAALNMALSRVASKDGDDHDPDRR
jgi:CheY-like chemotaxis protein